MCHKVVVLCMKKLSSSSEYPSAVMWRSVPHIYSLLQEGNGVIAPQEADYNLLFIAVAWAKAKQPVSVLNVIQLGL
ncbi:CLUMA_CG010908, isoform A [Clunio marinus]|uniref:CLUMA_CG010908, isoform A n=1 Tax=Clunio marinus TaxID=568069 RepID=A0A1J1IB51_9DIPT|nr:CLUMA_CG010908, isoform A [Clunio marinus]